MRLAACMVVVLWVGVCAQAGEVLIAGRDRPENRDAAFRLRAGVVSDIEGLVEETTRQYYDVTDQAFKQATRESYDLNDFGMDDSYPAVGLYFENAWKYVTLQADVTVMNPDLTVKASLPR